MRTLAHFMGLRFLFRKYNKISRRSSLKDILCQKKEEYETFRLLNWKKRAQNTDFWINMGNENIIQHYGSANYVSNFRLVIS